MASTLIKDMEAVIQERNKIYRELYLIYQEQGEYLKKNDLARMQGVNQKQEKMMLQVQAVEQMVQKMMEAMALELKANYNPMDPAELFERLEEGPRRTFRKAEEEIAALKKDLERINKANGVLIANALKYLKVMGGPVPGPTAPGTNPSPPSINKKA